MLLRKSLESLKNILVHCSENWLTVVELLEKWLSYRPDLGTLCYLVQKHSMCSQLFLFVDLWIYFQGIRTDTGDDEPQ